MIICSGNNRSHVLTTELELGKKTFNIQLANVSVISKAILLVSLW